MIKSTCFKSNWIKNKHKEIKIDPILIERAIFAFELLGNLVINGVNLVFKGGTSLMLLIPELNRLSIDLDILTNEGDEKIKKVFNAVIKEGIFKRWEEDIRDSNVDIPKSHFKFYYNSPIYNKELPVLLDVLQIDSPFTKTTEKPILHPIFEVEEEVKIKIPTINSLTGDKLTAFAPMTIGVPYGKEKSMEIIKQLFDLGVLFEHITDLKEIYESYKNISQIEASFRNLSLPRESFLDDSINTSFLLCQSDFKEIIENANTRELRDGIMRIKSHILGGRYSILDAKEDASKIACLSSLIKDNQLDLDIEKLRKDRKDVNRIKDVELSDKFSILNKLKAISPESFYLWAITTKVL
jgi:hypothetical protein